MSISWVRLKGISYLQFMKYNIVIKRKIKYIATDLRNICEVLLSESNKTQSNMHLILLFIKQWQKIMYMYVFYKTSNDDICITCHIYFRLSLKKA